MKQFLPFVKNVALDFVQLFAKKTTRFEAETAFLSSSGKKNRAEDSEQVVYKTVTNIKYITPSVSLTLDMTYFLDELLY